MAATVQMVHILDECDLRYLVAQKGQRVIDYSCNDWNVIGSILYSK